MALVERGQPCYYAQRGQSSLVFREGFMTISHDPNHSHGTGLVMSEGAGETAEARVAERAASAQAARPKTRILAWLLTFLLGVAALGAGLIYFSFRPGLLALENMGAGLAALVFCLALVIGARRWIEAP